MLMKQSSFSPIMCNLHLSRTLSSMLVRIMMLGKSLETAKVKDAVVMQVNCLDVEDTEVPEISVAQLRLLS